MKKNKLFLVCTGLGKINRGFESYISDLAGHLTESSERKYSVQVYAGGSVKSVGYRSVRILSLSRNNLILQRLKISFQKLFLLEQICFFTFFFPHVLLRKPKAIYLGEYTLYCYLFKIRKYLRLKYALVLYTGGQAAPGLFDNEKDFVHHITDIYYADLIKKGIPENRQFVIPHFVNTHFEVDKKTVEQLRARASGKKIVLSVGSIDKSVKRMDLIPFVLGDFVNSIFPIVLGEWTNESEAIRQSMIERFGEDGFIFDKIPRTKLGSFYTAADVFILCSKKESFGLVLLEAMFFELPVICHAFYEARWVCKDKATFINMDNIDLFKENFRLLLPEFQKKLSFNSFVLQNYTWLGLKDSYLNMFERITQ